MSGWQLWVLDDEAPDVVSKLLEQDGWHFKFQGKSYGLEVTQLWKLKDLRNRLKGIDEIANLPLIALLDVDLGEFGGGSYGGFAAWRAIEDKTQEISRKTGRIIPLLRTKPIMYTRKPVLVPLAQYLSSAPANPLVLPFAGRTQEEALTAGGKYQFTEHLDRRVRELRQWFILRDRNNAMKLARRIKDASAEELLQLQLGPNPLPSLFPREVRRIVLDSIASSPASDSDARQIIVSELCGCHDDFRTAYFKLVWRLYKGTDRIVHRYRQDSKINHWFSQKTHQGGQPELSDACKVVKKAVGSWKLTLGDPLYHLPGSHPSTFKDSKFWKDLNSIAQKVVSDWSSFQDLASLCRETLTYKDVAAPPVLLRKALQIEPYSRDRGWEQLFQDLSVYIDDLKFIEEELSERRPGTYEDQITQKTLVNRTTVCRRETWFGGSRSLGLSFVVKIGRIESSVDNWSDRILSSARKDFDPGSLSSLRYVACNVYGGQLCILETKMLGESISVSRGVIALGSHQPRVLTDDERTELARNWGPFLESGYVFNIMTFLPVIGDAE